MHNYSGTNPHRGVVPERRRGIKQLIPVLALGSAAMLFLTSAAPPSNGAGSQSGNALLKARVSAASENVNLRAELDSARAHLAVMSARLTRAQGLIAFSTRYSIGANVAGMVYDAAKGEGIDPELAFRLVKLESGFDPKATSRAGAIGLTQLMPATARFFQKGVRAEQLQEPVLNLRIGFRYLRTLVDQYGGNMNMALLVYNRGEAAVRGATAQGLDPTNGYDRLVMKGYKGKGVDY